MSENKDGVSNKVFSYCNIERINRNYSRKNFAETLNQQVIFDSCIFQNTVFHNAQIVQCRFINCTFIDFDFHCVIFNKNVFNKCSFSGILFYKCSFVENEFEECSFEKSVEYPYHRSLTSLQQIDVKHEFSPMLDEVLKKAVLHQHIRESNTLFRKVRNSWSKSIKQSLKKVSKKDGDKLGWSKKQRLAENAQRKQQRNELHKQNYENSQQGKNRELDEGLLNFLLTKYTETELIVGLQHCINVIDFKFNSISYLIKYIDQANK